LKVASLLDIVDLGRAVEANEFAARKKYVNQERVESLVVKFDERFPGGSVMPTEPKNLNEHPAIAGQKKHLIDLTFSDWELLRFAYSKAVAHHTQLRVDLRKKNLRKIMDGDNLQATLRETSEQRFRILMLWIGRFHMEKLFQGARLRSLEDFQTFLVKTYAHSTEEHRMQLGLFLRQFGLDPKHSPSLIVFQKITGKDRQLIRRKTEDQTQLILDFTDLRLKMAQLNASAQFAHVKNIYLASVETGDALRKLETLTEMKIKAIK
jgi:hypothetical protein